MGLDAFVTLSVIFLALCLVTFSRLSADSIFAGGLSMLLIAGILSPEEAFVGFANEGIATIAVLCIVFAGLKDTGGIAWLSQRWLRKPSSLALAQLNLWQLLL